MKIVVIPPQLKLDYLAESVIEGMYKCGVEIISSQLGNGIREEDVYSESGVLSHVEDCDYVFAIWGKRNGGYPGIDYDMVIKTGAPHKTAYIDGSEWTFNGHPNVGQVSDSKSNPKLRRGEP
jgi:hypothetical protein